MIKVITTRISTTTLIPKHSSDSNFPKLHRCGVKPTVHSKTHAEPSLNEHRSEVKVTHENTQSMDLSARDCIMNNHYTISENLSLNYLKKIVQTDHIDTKCMLCGLDPTNSEEDFHFIKNKILRLKRNDPYINSIQILTEDYILNALRDKSHKVGPNSEDSNKWIRLWSHTVFFNNITKKAQRVHPKMCTHHHRISVQG